jgi:hypothetical protein
MQLIAATDRGWLLSPVVPSRAVPAAFTRDALPAAHFVPDADSPFNPTDKFRKPND